MTLPEFAEYINNANNNEGFLGKKFDANLIMYDIFKYRSMDKITIVDDSPKKKDFVYRYRVKSLSDIDMQSLSNRYDKRYMNIFDHCYRVSTKLSSNGDFLITFTDKE